MYICFPSTVNNKIDNTFNIFVYTGALIALNINKKSKMYQSKTHL